MMKAETHALHEVIRRKRKRKLEAETYRQREIERGGENKLYTFYRFVLHNESSQQLQQSFLLLCRKPRSKQRGNSISNE